MNLSQHPYFDFLLAKSSQSLVQRLDPVSEKLLEFIALENHKGNPTTMMQALRFSTNLLLSEKTIANRIKQLQTLDLIEVHVDQSDRRVKFLYPSRKASDYFNLLSDQIAIANPTS
jgi:hypothetical protein